MILKLDRPLVCFDLETTGLDTSKDRIVEIGFVRLYPDGRRDQLQKRCDPGIDIPEGATKIHGICTDDVRGLFGEPTLPKLAKEIFDFLGDADLLGFNSIGYDLPLLMAEIARHDLPFTMDGRLSVDAKRIFDRKELSWDRFLQGPRNLNNAVLHYCGRDQAASFAKRDEGEDDKGGAIDDQNRHSAVLDAEATLDVLLAQLERYGDLPRDVKGLHDFCNALQDQTATN